MAYEDYDPGGVDAYQPPTFLKPGDPGYRQAPWSPSYTPGPNWNNGVAHTDGGGRYDYNGGSAPNSPNEPLLAGNSWQWDGPQTPVWNATVDQWDRGVWQQRGRTPPGTGGGTTGSGTTPPPSGPTAPTGSVPSVPAQPGIAVPSSTLPGDIAGMFGSPPAKTPIQNAYQDALLKYMGRSQELPSLSDPTLAPQVEVYRAGQQRGQERQRLVASERAAATGQSQSGYLDNLINKGVQDQAFNTSAFNANLLGGEMNKRREELNAALQLAGATGNQEASRELQNRLAQASAMMQQQGLNLQGQLGFGDLDLRRFLGTENLNQNALQLIMGGL